MPRRVTRQMSDDLAAKVQELERLLAHQKLQLENLLSAPAGPSTVQQPATNFDVTRIPDIIKLIPGYDGDVKGLPAWITSVQQKLDCALAQVPTSEKDNALKLWSSIIRDKITGKASEVLITNQTECKWDNIKSQLTDRFADKRDLATIVNRIPYIKQGNLTVEQFYFECSEILSDLSAKVNLDPNLQPCAKAVVASYETMIINAFIDGLHEPFSSLVRTSRPSSLLSAYQHAMEQSNAADRRKEKLKFQNKPSDSRVQNAPPNSSRRPTANQSAYHSNRPGNNFNSNQNRQSGPSNNNHSRSQFQNNRYNSGTNQNYQSSPQQGNTRQLPQIKQEAFSGSNVKKHQINTNEEVLNNTIEQEVTHNPEIEENEYSCGEEDLNFQMDEEQREMD